MLTIWWCPCVESSFGLLKKGGCLWLVCYLHKTISLCPASFVLQDSVVAIGLERSVFIQISKKGNTKECSNYHTVVLISLLVIFMLKILQARLWQCMNWELPDVQTALRKGRGTRNQVATIYLITEKARAFQKKIYLCFIEYAKVFDCWSQNSCGKFFKNWEYQTILLVSWETCMQLTKQQLKSDMEQ